MIECYTCTSIACTSSECSPEIATISSREVGSDDSYSIALILCAPTTKYGLGFEYQMSQSNCYI